MNETPAPLAPEVAVIVDSRRSEFRLADSTVIPALRFWGFPHRIVDLAEESVTDASGSALVLVAQEYLGEALGEDALALVALTERGASLVNLDHTLFAYPEAYVAALRLSGVGRETSVDGLVIPERDHTILDNVVPGRGPRLRFPLPATPVTVDRGDVQLESETGAPLVVSGTLGTGRFVQWAVSPKIWNRGYLGLAHGVDSLLWRGLLWAAPKPFAVNSLRPYVRWRFDDCYGHWQGAEDFRFLDELVGRGQVASICFCRKAVSREAATYLGDLQRAGKIDLAPHTYAPGVSIFFGDADGEYSDERFAEIFADLDAVAADWGVTWSTIISDHDHEWSRRAVPFLKERGFRHKMNITLPGEQWNDPHVDWHPAPYGSMSYALDRLPGDLSGFFAVLNHHPSFDSARVYTGDDIDSFFYHHPGGYGSQKWDFLNGLVSPDEANDLDTAIARIVEHTQIGLDAQFFGGSITHSHFTRHLAAGEMGRMLDEARKRLSRIEQIPASYDEVADYAEARSGTAVASARIEGPDLVVTLTGSSHRELSLSVYTELDGRLQRNETTIPAFDGEVAVSRPI